VITGRAYDVAGAYQSRFIMLLSLPCLVGALMTLLLPRYQSELPAAEALYARS
jgi:hypothetical protein